MEIMLPNSVRYVKNGRSGRWWQAARVNAQIHLGWKNVPQEILLTPDFPRIKQVIEATFGPRQGATQDFNALRDLLQTPSKHVWVTFEDGYMWWCTVLDGAIVNPDGESQEQGHFWLACDRHWSKCSLKGVPFAISDLPGTVTTTAGFKGTVCTPKAWEAILRIIQDEKDPDVANAAKARSDYQGAVLKVVKKLSPMDFEQLIDLILARTGWTRISTLGKTQEGIDLETENLAVGEIAFVQVKSSADQKALDEYVEKFQKRRDRYARMIFAVHSPIGKVDLPTDLPCAVQVWTDDQLAQLVVRLGLGEWVESRIP